MKFDRNNSQRNIESQGKTRRKKANYDENKRCQEMIMTIVGGDDMYVMTYIMMSQTWRLTLARRSERFGARSGNSSSAVSGSPLASVG